MAPGDWGVCSKMKKYRKFEIVGCEYNNPSELPREDDVLYRCTKCGGMIPSRVSHSIGCGCRNIAIDMDYFRLTVRNFRQLEVVRMIDCP